MKILMVQPMGSGTPPLGLCMISAILKRAGYNDITLVDLMVERIANKVVSPVRTEEYLQKKLEERPDVIFLGASVPIFHIVTEMAKRMKSYCGLLLLGGPHPTMYKDKVLEECPYVDALVYGEADFCIVPLLKKIEEGLKTGNYDFSSIENVVWRKGDEIIVNKASGPIMDLDQLPFPDRDVIDLGSYHGALSIFTSRGCPHACTFCSRPVTGNIFRGRSANNIVDEIEEILTKYPDVAERSSRTFTIADENFGVNKNRVVETCDEIIRRDLNIRLVLPTGIHVTGAQDLEVLKKMKAAGCDLIAFGIESGNETVLRNIKKASNRNMIKQAVKLCHEAGITVVGHFVVGLPGDTLQIARETIKFFEETGFDSANFNYAVPHPGTPFWDYVEKNGNFLVTFTPMMDYSNFYFDENDKNKMNYEKVVFDTPDFPEGERIKAYTESVAALDRKIRKRVFSFKNIKRFLFSINSFVDVQIIMSEKKVSLNYHLVVC